MSEAPPRFAKWNGEGDRAIADGVVEGVLRYSPSVTGVAGDTSPFPLRGNGEGL